MLGSLFVSTVYPIGVTERGAEEQTDAETEAEKDAHLLQLGARAMLLE